LNIIDFNPLSLWGLRHFFQSWLEQLPWSGHYFTAGRLTDWMQLLGFDQKKHIKVGYLPPIQKPGILKHLSWLEKGMRNKIIPGKVVRPSVSHGNRMKYDKK